ASRCEQHAALGGGVGIAHVDLKKEAVELRLGEGISAFLLKRVLRREHMEGTGHVMADAGHRDVVLLHRLEQSGLGLRAGAVDLVGHEELSEDGALDEAEAPAASGLLLEHL